MSDHKFIRQNGVLINTDDASYENYINQRNILKQKHFLSQNLDARVSKVESELSEIKNMLSLIVEKLNG